MTAQLRTLLRDLAEHLEGDELRVLVAIGERLTLGRRAYGPLVVAGDRRDWRKEAHEEALDLSVYLAIETLGRGVADTERPPPFTVKGNP